LCLILIFSQVKSGERWEKGGERWELTKNVKKRAVSGGKRGVSGNFNVCKNAKDYIKAASRRNSMGCFFAILSRCESIAKRIEAIVSTAKSLERLSNL
jgi:hypothetical protein